jgi:hypothetical protein
MNKKCQSVILNLSREFLGAIVNDTTIIAFNVSCEKLSCQAIKRAYDYFAHTYDPTVPYTKPVTLQMIVNKARKEQSEINHKLEQEKSYREYKEMGK